MRDHMPARGSGRGFRAGGGRGLQQGGRGGEELSCVTKARAAQVALVAVRHPQTLSVSADGAERSYGLEVGCDGSGWFACALTARALRCCPQGAACGPPRPLCLAEATEEARGDHHRVVGC